MWIKCQDASKPKSPIGRRPYGRRPLTAQHLMLCLWPPSQESVIGLPRAGAA